MDGVTNYTYYEIAKVGALDINPIDDSTTTSCIFLLTRLLKAKCQTCQTCRGTRQTSGLQRGRSRTWSPTGTLWQVYQYGS